MEEGLEAAAAGADIVMLDNFDEITIHPAAKLIKDKYPSILIEASGVRMKCCIYLVFCVSLWLFS